MNGRWACALAIAACCMAGCQKNSPRTSAPLQPNRTPPSRETEAKIPEKTEKNWEDLLKKLQKSATEDDLSRVAREWSEWVLSDPKRLELARRVLEEPQVPASVAPETWKRFHGHFRNAFLVRAAERYDVSLPERTQSEITDLLCRHAGDSLRPKLGDAILENMRRQERISLSAVRALGRLGAADAAHYLRLFVDFDVPDALRGAVLEALSNLQNDPAALEVLYALARPLLMHWADGAPVDARERARALQALAGLGLPRACRLPKTEYRFLARAFGALERKKPEGHETGISAVMRLMLCTDPAAARTRIPPSLQNALQRP